MGLLLTIVLTGCSSGLLNYYTEWFHEPPLTHSDLHGAHTKILPVPFYESKRSCCGWACLKMVQDYWHDVPMDATRPAFNQCPESGYSLKALSAEAHSRGLRAFIVQPTSAQLTRYLHETIPAILLLKKSFGYHYVVLVGFASGSRFVVNDPVRGKVFIDKSRLFQQWKHSRQATLILLPKPAG